jgi:hypothetical protein
MLQVELPEVPFFLAPVTKQPLDLGNPPIDPARSKTSSTLLRTIVDTAVIVNPRDGATRANASGAPFGR